MQRRILTFTGRCPQFLASGSIYYLEPEYCEPYHIYIRVHFHELSEMLRTKNRSFIYYDQKPATEILSYNYPGEYRTTKTGEYFTADLTRRLFDRLKAPCPNKPMLLAGVNDVGRKQGKIICIFPDKPDDIARILQNTTRKAPNVLNSLEDIKCEYAYPTEDADRDFSEIAYRLTMEVEKNIEILQLYGYDTLLREILDMHQPQLSRMEITADYRIFLPDYGNMEIKMTPLAKAVYFLFLDYPRGIMFRDLSKPEYMRKLNFIYKTLSNRSDYMKIQDSIFKISNHRNNSINEKCSRIREAFVSKFTDNLAATYYITGCRDTPKRIELDRKMITWQGYPYDPELWNKRMQYGKDHDEMIAFERREAELNRQIRESLDYLSDIFGAK